METLKLNQIITDPNQPRKYFAVEKMSTLENSIKKHGIVNPLIVEKSGDKYLIVDGERRYRVATELNMKEVPVVVISSKDPIARLIEQFHIQETHEGWTAAEKAQVLGKLSEETGQSLKEICEWLGIPLRTANRYLAFSRLGAETQEKMIENQIGIDSAYGIEKLKRAIKKIKEDKLQKSFSLTDERNIEKAAIKAIKDGQINSGQDYTKIIDSFTMNPKMIEKFINREETVSEMFVGSKAKTAFHLRNLKNSAQWIDSHGQAFLKSPNLKIPSDTISYFKRAIKTLEQIITLVGDDGE